MCRRVFTSCLLTGAAAGCLLPLILIALYGSVRISEPSPAVLVLEILVFAGIAAYGILSWILEIREHHKECHGRSEANLP